jgi:hypothetical protein
MHTCQRTLFDALEDAEDAQTSRQPLLPLAEVRARLDGVIARLADGTANVHDWQACASTGLHCPTLEAEAHALMAQLGSLYPWFWSLEACLERFPAPPLPQTAVDALARLGVRYHGAWRPWPGHVSHGQPEHVLETIWTIAGGIEIRSCAQAGVETLLGGPLSSLEEN